MNRDVLNQPGAAQGALIRAAASTPPLHGSGDEDETKMMLRRNLLLALGFVGLSRACAKPSSSSTSIAALTDESSSLPPHCEALSLVWKNQQDQIKELELKHASAEQKKVKEYVGADGRWWFDTDDRRWTVTRPFAPGGIDSTHWFTVTYLIGTSEKLSWSVDTSKQTVALMKE